MHVRHLILWSTTALVMSTSGCTSVLGINGNPAVSEPIGANGSALCTGTVYVRIASDFSGDATDIAIPHFWGIYDYLRQLNANGGIRGCPIDIDVKDNNYTAAQTTTVVDAWRATDPHYADVNTFFIFGTGPTTAVGPQIMAEQKIIIPGSYAGSLSSPTPINKTVQYESVNTQYQQAMVDENKTSPGWPYIFFPATDYSTGIRLAIQAAWMVQAGKLAFAHDTSNNCSYCVDPLAAGASFLPSLQGMSLGRDLIIPQTSDPTQEPVIASAVNAYFSDPTTGELAHFKTANATSWTYDPVVWIWSGNSVFATAILTKYVAAAQTAINNDTTVQSILKANNKTWTVRVMANNWGIGETSTTYCGAACNGDILYGLFPVPKYADLNNSVGMPQLIALHDQWGQADQTTPPPPPMTARTLSDYRDVRYVQGYAAALMWQTAMNMAIDAGHSNPTGTDLKNAFESFSLQEIQGMTAGPITFGAADHRPQSNESIYKLDQTGQLAFVDHYSVGLVPQWLGY